MKYINKNEQVFLNRVDGKFYTYIGEVDADGFDGYCIYRNIETDIGVMSHPTDMIKAEESSPTHLAADTVDGIIQEANANGWVISWGTRAAAHAFIQDALMTAFALGMEAQKFKGENEELVESVMIEFVPPCCK